MDRVYSWRRKPVRYFSLAVLIGSMFAVSSDASGQCAVNRCRVVQRQVAAVAVQPLVVSVPAYGAAYQPAPASNDVTLLSAKVDALVAEVTALKQQNAAIAELTAQVKALAAQLAIVNGPVVPPPPVPQGPPPPKPEQVKPPAPEAVKPPQAGDNVKALALFMQTNCAACHEAKVAKQKGGDVVFFDGAVMRALTCEQSMDCIKQTKNGIMPKGKPLNDADFGKFEDLLLAQVKTKAKP